MGKIFLPLMLIIFLMTGCGRGEQNSKNINSTKYSRIITIGVDDEFAPICFHDANNNLVGFDIDLAKEAARRMNVEVEFKPIDWDKKREAITSGSVDMIWNGLDITDERKEYMIFSEPYMDDRQVLLIRTENAEDIRSISDLKDKIVGTQAGSTSETYLNQDEDFKNEFKEFKAYDKLGKGLDDLKNGAIDVFICDELVARYEMKEHPNQLEIIGIETGVITPTGIGFAKDKTELRDRVQKVFDEMIKDGTAKKISIKWFQADLIKVR